MEDFVNAFTRPQLGWAIFAEASHVVGCAGLGLPLAFLLEWIHPAVQWEVWFGWATLALFVGWKGYDRYQRQIAYSAELQANHPRPDPALAPERGQVRTSWPLRRPVDPRGARPGPNDGTTSRQA